MSDAVTTAGTCRPEFQGVAEAFVENFASRGEVGASLCVRVDGETVVDLWGGTRNLDTGEPWEEDTVSIVFSCTKAATALCAHRLIDRGELDVHAPMSTYWPEFAQNGKEKATVLMALNHSVGVPALREPVKQDGFCDWDYMVERLAAEEPFWEPGTRNGYHMTSFGWTVGELVRRVSGKSLGTFFREEIAEPLGIDFWIGFPESEEHRLATMIPFVPDPTDPPTDFVIALLSDPTSLQFLALLNGGNTHFNDRAFRAAEIGGGGGVANARALAGMYAPLAANDGSLLSPDRVLAMRQASMVTGRDATLLIPSRFAQGFMLSIDNRNMPPGQQDSSIIGEKAFGHDGMGGSVGFADPECGLSFGYTMNNMGGSILLNDRGQSLVDATYQALGYRTNEPGFWAK